VAAAFRVDDSRTLDTTAAKMSASASACGARRRGLRKGEVVDLGPDGYAWMGARERLVQMLTAGWPPLQPACEKVES
jgi:hypothetical protein